MTISFRSQANAAGATGSACVVNLPAGTISGDFMFALFQSTFPTGAGPVNTLSGWTALASYNAGYPNTWLFYRVAGSSEPSSYSWSVSGGDGTSMSGAIVTYQGGPSIDVAGASISHSATGTNTVAGITTTNSGLLVLLSSQRIVAGLSLSTPAGFTQQMDVNPNAGCELGVYDKTNASVGATGTVTQTGATFGVGGILIQLYSAVDNGTAAWTEADDVNTSSGTSGNPSSGTIAVTEQNDTSNIYQNSVTISWGSSPSYVDNGQDGVTSYSGSVTGTPTLTTTPSYPTMILTDNSGSSNYVTLQQQGFNLTTGRLDGNSGYAWPGYAATPTQVIGSLAGTTLTVASVTAGGAIVVGHQIAVAGSTLAGPVQVVSNVSGPPTGASIWTVTNPSSVTEPISTAMGLSLVGGLTHTGRYYVPTNIGLANDAGLFSDAQQGTGTSQLMAVQAVDSGAFNAVSVYIAPVPNFSTNGTMYVKISGYTGTPVTVLNNTLMTTGATLTITQTLVHTAGAAYQKFDLYGFGNVTSIVTENTGWANGNIVGGSASNSPPYSFSYLQLVPLSPNFANLNWTEADDVNAATGSQITAGSASWTEASDVNTSSGSLSDSGSVIWTEANDVNTSSGILSDSGSSAWTEANDTNASSGSAINVSTAAWAESNDINASSGVLSDSGSIATIESDDVNTVTGSLTDNGTTSWTEANDANVATGIASTPGSIAWTEANDANVATGSEASSGIATWTEANDTNASSGSVLNTGSASWTEADDVNAATGSISGAGSIAWTEANDTNASSGSLSDSGSVIWTEANDVNTAVGAEASTGTAAWIEANDVNIATGSGDTQFITGRLNTFVIRNRGTNPVTLWTLPTLRKSQYDSLHYNIDLTEVLLPPGSKISTVISLSTDQGEIVFGDQVFNIAKTILQVQISGGAIPNGESELACTISLEFTTTLTPDRMRVSMVLILRYLL